MSRRRAVFKLLEKLAMASKHFPGGSVAGAGTRKPAAVRGAAASFSSSRALESLSTPPRPSPTTSTFPSTRSRPLLPASTLSQLHTRAVQASSSILQRSLYSHQRPRSFSAGATRSDVAASASAAASTDAAEEDEDEPLDSFLAPPSVTFASLGIDSVVCDALAAAGIAHPSAVQASAIPPLLSSSDAVLAAQTGSGKTIAYLAPLICRLRSAQALPRVDDDDDDDDEEAALDFDNESKAPSIPTLVLPSADEPPPSSLGLLVLCPNAALCDQVVSVCNDVFARGGLRLTAARVGGVGGDGGSSSYSSSQQLPYPPPDVTVATPAGLLGATYASGGGASWSPAAVISRTRAVVLDEADALLGGGYARDSRRVLEGMRAADEGVRLASAKEWLASQKKKGENASSLPFWKDLPQKARRAARDGGARALALELKSSLPGCSFSELPSDLPRRQYVFAAATMPEDPRMTDAGFGVMDGGGRKKKDSRRLSNSAPAGAMLRKEFPEAVWVGGFALHRPSSSVEHVWVDLDDDDDDEGEVEGTNRGSKWARALVEAVSSSSSSSLSSSSALSSSSTTTTLVFARTAGAAAEVSARLRASGIDALEYSSAISLADRKRALAALRSGAAGEGEELDSKPRNVVVVATDAAARGLDLGTSSSGVDHVVQADFAANAVDWLHRVGRTGRGPLIQGGNKTKAKRNKGAGARGRVTCLVSRGDAALADAIRGALEAGQPVDGSFSRNRSFRNKLKKYGEFVPRGEVFKGGGGGRG